MPYNEQEKNNPSEMTGKHKGMQGIDKAPGEENAENIFSDARVTARGSKPPVSNFA